MYNNAINVFFLIHNNTSNALLTIMIIIFIILFQAIN